MTVNEWDAARKNGDKFFLYRIEYLNKRSGKKPNLIEINYPYKKLVGEPTRFKLNLNIIKGKYTIIPMAATPTDVSNNVSE